MTSCSPVSSLHQETAALLPAAAEVGRRVRLLRLCQISKQDQAQVKPHPSSRAPHLAATVQKIWSSKQENTLMQVLPGSRMRLEAPPLQPGKVPQARCACHSHSQMHRPSAASSSPVVGPPAVRISLPPSRPSALMQWLLRDLARTALLDCPKFTAALQSLKPGMTSQMRKTTEWPPHLECQTSRQTKRPALRTTRASGMRTWPSKGRPHQDRGAWQRQPRNGPSLPSPGLPFLCLLPTAEHAA